MIDHSGLGRVGHGKDEGSSDGSAEGRIGCLLSAKSV